MRACARRARVMRARRTRVMRVWRARVARAYVCVRMRTRHVAANR